MSLASRPTYSDPAYLVRQSQAFGPVAAGNAGVTTKFVAFANLQAYGISLNTVTLGTSTYSSTQSGQQISLLVVTNTSTTVTVALATSTYGPFLAGGQGTAAAQVGGYNQYALNTNTATTGFGGVPVPQGAIWYCVSGTDATAVTNCTVDYQVQPLAGLTQ